MTSPPYLTRAQTEQEQLLTKLRKSESSTNSFYTAIFTGLPCVVTLPFLWYLSLSTTRPMALLCLLSITSLASSAYVMYFVPVSHTAGASSSSASSSVARTAQRPVLPVAGGEESPVNQYLPYLNAFICALLLLASWGYSSRTDVPEGLWLFLLLPAVVCGMVFVARRSIGDIQAGLGELQGLKYDYKGA
jgi:hypothetical protein